VQRVLPSTADFRFKGKGNKELKSKAIKIEEKENCNLLKLKPPKRIIISLTAI
jgi:hypothetical protein